MERLVKGRERIYLDRFWNEFSADPKSFNEASRRHYAKFYARPGAMRSGFEQFRAFDQDAIDNTALLAKGHCRCPSWPSGERSHSGRRRRSWHAQPPPMFKEQSYPGLVIG
jgi:hypothetical protein